MPALLPTGTPLAGRVVRLDRFTEADVAEMVPLLRDPAVYEQGYVMHARPADDAAGAAFARHRYVDVEPPDGLGRGRIAYAVRLVADSDLGPAGTLVGSTSFGDCLPVHESGHLGWTLYGRRWWATAVNPETKLLLLGHAFDDLGYGRVKLVTDQLNTRSQAAIARLGAVREGVLRRETRREDGTFRDTVVFSVTVDDWPGVKAGLLDRLGR